MAEQRFIFKNIDTGQEIELFNVADIEGFGIPDVQIAANPRGWRRDGASVQHMTYAERVFSIQFDISEMTYEQAAQQRRDIIRFFADKGGRALQCVRFDGVQLELCPVYIAAPTVHRLHETPYIENLMQFVAENPYFRREIPVASVALEDAKLEWDLEWLEGGIEFATASNKITVTNNGDVEADAVIRFEGEATTPYVENVTTGAKITVNRSLLATDVLEINSATGRVDIIAQDGTRNNAFNYLTDTSKLIKLATGLNTLEYGSAGGGGTLSVGGDEYYASL